MVSPDVLKTSNVLNNLHSTEPTLYGVFKHGLENDLPYIVEGVYKRTSSIDDGFPVFEHKQKSLYFQFSKRPRQLYFSKDGPGRGKYFGVSAAVLSTFSFSSITDRKHPFKDSVVYWQRYKPFVKRHKTLASGAFCISDDIYECSSGRSHFNRSLFHRQTGATLHNRRTDFVFKFQAIFVLIVHVIGIAERLLGSCVTPDAGGYYPWMLLRSFQ